MRATFAALLAALLLAACGGPAASPTPAHLTIPAVLAAWDEAGLVADDNGTTANGPPGCAAGLPGLESWYWLHSGSTLQEYTVLTQFTTPEQAADARERCTNNLLNSYRRDTVVLTAMKNGPNIQTHLSLFLALR